MKISGFIETSFVDWDGMICSVIFLAGCNFRCPFCHNSEMVLNPSESGDVPFSKIKHFLKLNKGWVDGVCITGGEPTLYKDLLEFCSKIKELGFKVKLDTNGTNFSMLKKLVDGKLIDFVAMDVKTQLDEKKYFKVAGFENRDIFKNILDSIAFLMSGKVDYEFRTTIVPELHTLADMRKLSSYIKNAKKYAIQNFKPGYCLDKSFNNLKSFDDKELRQFVYAAKENINNVILRG